MHAFSDVKCFYNESINYSIKSLFPEDGDMTQWLRALPTLTEDLSTHMAVHKSLPPFLGNSMSFSPLWALHVLDNIHT